MMWLRRMWCRLFGHSVSVAGAFMAHLYIHDGGWTCDRCGHVEPEYDA